MKLLRKYWQIIAIFLFALIIRTWDLNNTPSGFHADEAKVGWNAYSFLKTGADDWGNKFPLHYNTFGDFRPTGIIYLTVPSIAIFGLNEFAVRLPGALAGALTVVILYLFIRELVRGTKLFTSPFPLFTATMLTLSPWHITLSRATSEAIIAILLTLTGLWLLIKSLNTKNNKFLLVSTLFLLSSYFLYHSARLLVPVLVLTTLLYHFKRIPQGLVLVPLITCSLFTLIFALNPSARGRLNQVSIFADLDVKYELDKMPFEDGPNNVLVARIFHNKLVTYSKHFINEYSRYFSADFFLRPKVAKPGRYQTVGMGILTYVELALFVVGIVFLIKNKTPLKLVLVLLLLAPLPAALTTEDAPNLHRAAYMIPLITALSGYGLWSLSRIKVRKIPLFAICNLLLALNFVYFSHQYLIHNKVGNTMSRNVGAKELALKLNEVSKNYDKILLTDIPDSLYPWIAFVQKPDPATLNEKAKTRDKGPWSFGKYVFLTARCPSRDAFNDPGKILAVDADACEAQTPPGAKILTQIKRPDETIVYTLWARDAR